MPTAIYDAGKDKVLAVFFTNEKVKETNKNKSRYCLVDTAKDEVIAETVSRSSGESFAGSRANGETVFYDPESKNILIYSADMKETREIPLVTFDKPVYDSEKDVLYATEGENFISVDMEGNKKNSS